MFDGYDTNFKYQRVNFRSNMDVDVSRNLTISLNMAARMEDTNEPGSTGYEHAELQNAFSALTRTPPYETPVFQANGKPGVGPMGTNPVLQVNGGGYTQHKKDVVEASLQINYKLDRLLQGLSFRALGSYDSYYSKQNAYTKSTATYRLESAPGEEDVYTVIGEDTKIKYDTGGGKGGVSTYQKLYGEAGLYYVNDFGKNNVTGLMLANLEDKKYGGTYVPYRYTGLVGRITYNYDERYFGEVNMGYNGSENFAKGQRFGFFPSFSAGWMLTNEAFLKDRFENINFLKLRLSYGKVGNDRIGGDRFLYLTEYVKNVNAGWVMPGLPQFGTSASERPIVYLPRVGNPNITWETSHKYNIGLETGFFKNSLMITVDGFYEKRNNILLERQSVGQYLGINPSYGNLGETSNRGFELEGNYRYKIKNDMEFWTKVTYSFARNKVEFKDEPDNKLAWQTERGQRIGQFFGYQVLRFFDIDDFDEKGELLGKYPLQLVGERPQPGDFQYKDVNGDGIVDERDKVAIGYSDIPEGTFGFSMGLNWKNFDFSFLFQGAYNVSLNISSESLYEFCEGGKVLEHHLGRWAYYTDPFTGELIDTRATATYPRLHSQSSSPNWTTNDFFLYNSSYLKLRNVELGYTFPKGIKTLGISALRFYAQGANLLTLSKVKQLDPEGPGYGSNRERGWNYPQLAIINFGFNVTF
jgi:TonB-linked SusC/RagA family outer membrane protein